MQELIGLMTMMNLIILEIMNKKKMLKMKQVKQGKVVTEIEMKTMQTTIHFGHILFPIDRTGNQVSIIMAETMEKNHLVVDHTVIIIALAHHQDLILHVIISCRHYHHHLIHHIEEGKTYLQIDDLSGFVMNLITDFHDDEFSVQHAITLGILDLGFLVIFLILIMILILFIRPLALISEIVLILFLRIIPLQSATTQLHLPMSLLLRSRPQVYWMIIEPISIMIHRLLHQIYYFVFQCMHHKLKKHSILHCNSKG
mmetsp:Transcript_12607/g.16969  ORF Transcript_12607/g.16969 Transcript_12607/m.16969 type:complete len:256 (-) Transcript_12607:897-1664(-)